MSEKPRLERQAMCDRLAMEFQDDWIVNLGVGMPTLCSNYVDPTKSLIFHSENGVIGYGPLATPETKDRHLVNAGGQNVTAVPGMAIVHHADSFALIRKGMLDVTVMGAYEAAENGDFANWRIPNRKGGGIGGAWTWRPAPSGSLLRWSTLPGRVSRACSSAARCPSRRQASSHWW